MIKTQTALQKVKNYEEAEKAVVKLIELLGGLNKFIKSGDKALLKPNLLYGEIPEKLVNTHPAVIEAVIKLLLDAGCKIVMGDSPSIGTGLMHAKKPGYLELCRRYNVEWAPFEDPILIEGGESFKRIETARIVSEVDAVINLAKVKTHGQTYLTLSVKNMFGIVPGVRKARWHMHAGRDLDFFCKMLVS